MENCTMTVLEIKALLSNLPDDARVTFYARFDKDRFSKIKFNRANRWFSTGQLEIFFEELDP